MAKSGRKTQPQKILKTVEGGVNLQTEILMLQRDILEDAKKMMRSKKLTISEKSRMLTTLKTQKMLADPLENDDPNKMPDIIFIPKSW